MYTEYTQEDFERELSEAIPGVPFKTVHGSTINQITRWFAHLPLFAGQSPVRIIGLYNITNKKRRYAAEFGTVNTDFVLLESERLSHLFKDILVQVFLRDPTLTPASLTLPCAAEWFREVAYDALDSLRTTLQARFHSRTSEERFLADLEATGLKGWSLCHDSLWDKPKAVLRFGPTPSIYVAASKEGTFQCWMAYGFAATSQAVNLKRSEHSYTEGILQCLRVTATRHQDLLSLPKLPGVFGQWHRNALLKCRENLEAEGNNLQAKLSATKDELDTVWPRLNSLNGHLSIYSNEDERQ